MMKESIKSNNYHKKYVAILFVVIVVSAISIQQFSLMYHTKEKHGITLTILTRHNTTIQRAFEEAFLKTDIAKKNNITDIRWIKSVVGLWDEILGQNNSIDIAWGGGPTAFDLLESEGYLEPIELDKLPESQYINDTLGNVQIKKYVNGKIIWIKTAISSFGFTINERFLNENNLPTPKTWIDLASPEFGKTLPRASISIGNAPYTSSNTRIYEIILANYGWNKGWSIITRIGGSAKVYDGSAEAQVAVETGEVGVAISIDFYGYTSQLKNKDCKYILPKNETIINGDPIALLKTSLHKNSAIEFINWVLSIQGQAIWLDERINRLPVRNDVFEKTDIGKRRYDLYRVYNDTITNLSINFNYTQALLYDDVLRLYFEAVITNVHDILVDAWNVLTNAYLTKKINLTTFDMYAYELGKPISWELDKENYTFTLNYAISINDKIKQNPAFAQKMQNIWANAAAKQYTKVKEQLENLLHY